MRVKRSRAGWLAFGVSLIVVMTLLTACRQSNQPAGDNDDIQMDLSVEPANPTVGQAKLLLTIRDAAGQPIDGATVSIRGDMAHAGMVPVLASATGAGDGRYEAILEWTMAGDWVVVAGVTLPDGRAFEREFPVQVRTG